MKASFQNRTAGVFWAVTAVWLGGLVAMTYVFWQDGLPQVHSEGLMLGVLLVCWACGIGLARSAASRPCIFITVDAHSQVLATWRYPHRVVRRVIPLGDLHQAQVVDSKDSDGNSYYIARVEFATGESIDLGEGPDRRHCEDTCAYFNQALFRARVGAST